MSYVTVLTPNGRRQNVKITPNTTLLQVLEEVCVKHGFKAEDYDIRHHNKILDVSSIFRFSGLPNNAFLEMTEAVIHRSESPVVLCLQLESGDRYTGEFSPSESLWNVILTLSPESKSFLYPVVIYMRKEVCGKENLEKTTLRTLGLTGGRAILRFLNRSPEELRSQANVSEVLSRTVTNENKTEKKKQVPQSPSPVLVKKSTKNEDGSNEKDQAKPPAVMDKDNKEVNKTDPSKEKKVESPKDTVPIQPFPTKDSSKAVEETVPKTSEPEKKCETVKDNQKSEVSDMGKNKVVLLGERNAVAYNLNTVKPVETEEMPDDFYELTVSDAQLLLRDAKQLCADLENAPLMTSAQRELEKNKKILSLLNQYKKTVLRIKFPDRTVLQGTFSSVEKISDVEKFVSKYLENPDTQFYLYTTPPKEILKSDNNLLETNCVPCAVLYFGVNSTSTECKQFLRSDVLEKFSSLSAAALTAYESRGMSNKTKVQKETKCEKPVKSDPSVPGPSASSSSSNKEEPQNQGNSPPFKVPKWFKVRK